MHSLSPKTAFRAVVVLWLLVPLSVLAAAIPPTTNDPSDPDSPSSSWFYLAPFESLERVPQHEGLVAEPDEIIKDAPTKKVKSNKSSRQNSQNSRQSSRRSSLISSRRFSTGSTGSSPSGPIMSAISDAASGIMDWFSSSRSTSAFFEQHVYTKTGSDAARTMFYDPKSPVFKAIMDAEVFEDSKDYVDSPSTVSFNQLEQAWSEINPSDVDAVRTFALTYFPKIGSELHDAPPEDWVSNPSFLKKARSDLKELSSSLHSLWRRFTKRVEDTSCSDCASSMLDIPNPFVVPGGRFRETYYWDTYFILEGLLVSNMYTTARGVIQNFIDFVDRYGFIPNGSRTYYLNRSQPPLLIQMVKIYYEATDDKLAILDWLPTLEKEIEFWESERSYRILDGSSVYDLFRYNVQNKLPRPEAYYRDMAVAEGVSSNRREQLYSDMASGAESGWDFSSRWSYLLDNRPYTAAVEDGVNWINPSKHSEFDHLRNTHTTHFLPVDLNAIMYGNFKTLEQFCLIADRFDSASEYATRATNVKSALNSIFWNEEDRQYVDFNITSNSVSKQWSLAGFFVHMFNATDSADRFEAYYRVKDIAMDFPGGVPTSLYETGLQWDFPNVWPPLQYALIKGIDNFFDSYGKSDSNHDLTSQLLTSDLEFSRALVIDKYVTATYCGWRRSRDTMGEGVFYEKYDARLVGSPGGGGEYGLVTGFGWTNGVLQWILKNHEIDVPRMDLLQCK